MKTNRNRVTKLTHQYKTSVEQQSKRQQIQIHIWVLKFIQTPQKPFKIFHNLTKIRKIKKQGFVSKAPLLQGTCF